MSNTLRRDVHVPNESDGFVFTSAWLRGRGLVPGEAAWLGAVAACELLPLWVESEDPANVRVVVGDLAAEEQSGWVGRVQGGLRVPDGRLALCGGAAFVMEAADWAAESVRIVDVPPGDYVVTLLCYASAPNGRWCLERSGSRERLGTWFRRTRPAEAMPAWLHNLCVHDPGEDPSHQVRWKKAKERPGQVIDFLLHLEPATALTPVATASGGFAEAAECRQPETFPLGLAPVDLAGLEEGEDAEGEDAAVDVTDVASRTARYEPQPIAGGPVDVPLVKLARVARLAWLCHPYTQPSIRIAFPGRPPRLEEVEGSTLRKDGKELHVGFENTGQPHGAQDALLALAKQLTSLPDGCTIELETARAREASGARPVGLHRYRGSVVAGSWRLAEAFPPIDAALLAEALSLTESMEPARRLLARDEAEAERILARVERHAPHVLQFPGLQRSGAELLLRKRDPAAFLEVVQRAFWMRYGDTWPLHDFDLAPPD
jgi:hypothetical protein